MFDDIGGKIKTLAVACTIIGIIASVIVGFIFFAEDEPGIGIAVIIGGAAVSWVSSFVLYGFGELIDNTDEIRSELHQWHQWQKKQSSSSSGAASKPAVAKNNTVASRPYAGKDVYAAAAAEASKRKSADGGHTWTCTCCFAKNPIDEMKCRSCGSPRG